jgi:hypothetical protein
MPSHARAAAQTSASATTSAPAQPEPKSVHPKPGALAAEPIKVSIDGRTASTWRSGVGILGPISPRPVLLVQADPQAVGKVLSLDVLINPARPGGGINRGDLWQPQPPLVAGRAVQAASFSRVGGGRCAIESALAPGTYQIEVQVVGERATCRELLEVTVAQP